MRHHYYRYYGTFPLQNGVWTEVALPWRELLQRNMRGSIESHLAEAFAIWFTVAGDRDPGYPYQAVPAHGYDVDNIRLVDSLSLDSTPVPSGSSIARVVAKLQAREPVKIVWVGASVSYGLKCTGPATQNTPTVLQGLLRDGYGYHGIVVLNRSVGGYSSFQGGANLGRWAYDETPDLIPVTFALYRPVTGMHYLVADILVRDKSLSGLDAD